MPFPRLLHKFDGLAELQDMQYPERLDTIPEKTFDTRVPKRGNAAHNVFQPTTKHGRFNIANPHFIHIVPALTPISLRKKAKGQNSKRTVQHGPFYHYTAYNKPDVVIPAPFPENL